MSSPIQSSRRGKPAARPRWATPATPRAKTWMRDVVSAASLLGITFMPHQRQVLRVITELDGSGLPRFPTALASMPRQQGKTWTVRPLLLAAALREPDQMIYYTAQTRLAARDRVLDAGKAFVNAGVECRVKIGVGAESVVFPNGSRIEPMSPSESAGHGASIDLLIVDELWAVHPHAMGAFVPALAARPRSQLVAISTMGTTTSEVMNRMVERGRDGEDRLAYFEWSIPDDVDPYSEDAWWRAMPALGRSVPIQAIRDAASTLTRGEFVRAFANRVVTSLEPVVPSLWWERSVSVPDAVPSGAVLCVDVNVGPSGASIAAGWPSGDESFHVELTDYQAGGSTSWLPPRLHELVVATKPRLVVVDPGGPAAVVFDELRSVCERTGVALRKMPPRDSAAAAGLFYEKLAQGLLSHGPSDDLDAAVEGAQKKDLGDQWVWHRRSSIGDVSPLIAVSGALYGAREVKLKPSLRIY